MNEYRSPDKLQKLVSFFELLISIDKRLNKKKDQENKQENKKEENE